MASIDPLLWAIYAISLAFLSLLGSSVVIYQIFRSQVTLTPSHEALVNAIFWMVSMDLFVSIWIIILYIPQLWGDVVYKRGTWREGFCTFLGFLTQFTTSASCSWYFMIALMTISLLRGHTNESIRRSIKYQHFFVWSTSGSAAIVLLVQKDLGIDVAVGNSPPVECWLSRNQTLNSLWLYAPVFFYVMFSLLLLLYAGYKARQFRDSQKILWRMVVFIFTFISVWMIPIVDHLRLVLAEIPPSVPLAFIHWGSIAISGFANAVVWCSTKPQQSSKHIPELKDTITYPDEETGLEDESSEELQWTLLHKKLIGPENNREPSVTLPTTGFTPERRVIDVQKIKHKNRPLNKAWYQKLGDFRKPNGAQNKVDIHSTFAATSHSLIAVDSSANGVVTVSPLVTSLN